MSGFVRLTTSEEETRRLGAELLPLLHPGLLVRLSGGLGAGKTTLVRGILEAAGWTQGVRSPTFSLLQVYDAAEPPILHADLYRVASAVGIGLEDYADTHALLVEWPDRLGRFLDDLESLSIHLEWQDDARLITVELG